MELNMGDTAWMIIATAMVFLMTPAIALFYGGMVRSKNVLNIIMQCLFIAGIITLEWVILGYSLAFSGDIGGVIGNLDKVFLAGIGSNLVEGGSIPELVFVAFQCMFAILTPAIMIGSVAERMQFKSMVLFATLWAVLLYNPMAHWVWGGGFLDELGALDFAGGIVIHILSGVSGLTLCILLGTRHGYGKMAMLPHNLPMMMLGASLLWFGWFGFNAGSAGGVNFVAANALLVTHIAAASGIVGWVAVEWLKDGKPTVLGAASGAVSGLVSITPGAGFIAPLPAIIVGLLGGLICYFAVAKLKARLGYDDTLDAFGIHGMGGTWGAVATGLFASLEVNPDGANGLVYGSADLLYAEVISTVIAYAFAVLGTVIIYKLIAAFLAMRVKKNAEVNGLDQHEHAESAYVSPLMGGMVTNGSLASQILVK